MSALITIADRTKNTMINEFIRNFLYLRVSNKRKGREELLKIAQSSREGSETRFNRLRSLFTGQR